MNEIVNKFLLAGEKFMSEMHIKEPGFTYSACEPFTKNKELKNLKKQEILHLQRKRKYIYRNELDKACFQHDMAQGDFKALARRTASDKILRDKEFNIAKNPKYDGYQRGLASIVYKFFDKSLKGVVLIMKLNKMSNQLTNYTNQLLKNSKKRRVYSSFVDNIWSADVADMQLISNFNK